MCRSGRWASAASRRDDGLRCRARPSRHSVRCRPGDLVDWNAVTEALACRSRFEFLCGPRALVDEAVVKLFAADVLGAVSGREIEPEFNHPDLLGNTRIDVVIWRPQRTMMVAVVELKWIRPTGATRCWHEEVAADALRVERVSAQLDTSTERVVLVAGTHKENRTGLLNRAVQNATPGLKRVPVLSHFLQPRPSGGGICLPTTADTRQVATCDPSLRKLFKAAAAGFETTVPRSCKVHLVGHFATGAQDQSIECFAWRVQRNQNRQTIDITA